MDSETIDRNFTHHPPTADQVAKYGELRFRARELAQRVHALCPDSREKAFAIQAIEQAVMWANAAIARNDG